MMTTVTSSCLLDPSRILPTSYHSNQGIRLSPSHDRTFQWSFLDHHLGHTNSIVKRENKISKEQACNPMMLMAFTWR